MEGLKCPICKAISSVSIVNEGEMYTCPFCNYKYTVIWVRRYFLQPYKLEKGIADGEVFREYIKNLDFHQLVEVIKIATKEMEKRLHNSEEKVVKSN